MIKLLYIPTGEFITFFNPDTRKLFIAYEEYPRYQISLNDRIEWWNEHSFDSDFTIRNKLIYPLQVEEFEVLDD